MKVLLLHIDGKLPNLALMRVSAHHRMLGDEVELRIGGNVERSFWDHEWDRVYVSAIFRKSIPAVERARRVSVSAILGGTAVDPPGPGEVIPLSPVIAASATSLAAVGIADGPLDYSGYPAEKRSIGFTQRGCRMKCTFCAVPRKEGSVRESHTIAEIWRGDPYPRELLLLDNDFFGQPNWRTRVEELRAGRFRVSFCQGINARFLDDEAAEAIASLDYRDDQMEDKRIYTAWDNRGDEARLFAGLRRLVRYGVRPDQIMVYILIGYDHATRSARPYLTEDDFYRRQKLREFGARPYPMPFVKTVEMNGFQRWIVKRLDMVPISWEEFKAAGYRPEKLGLKDEAQLELMAAVD